jgi:signal transduction histidine kinase
VPVAVGAALCLLPARQRVQQLVNRYLYGERDDPYAVVSRVATRLESAGTTEQLLSGLLDALTRALRLPFAAVELRGADGTRRRIEHGQSVEPSARFPLLHQGQDVGELRVGLRSGQPALSSQETTLLRDIARQLAVAASNVVPTEELIRSRERIISAAEEERRRLRGDLHDGLGPVLTAAANKVDAAKNLLSRNPSRADELLITVRSDLTAALADLRRLVYALRPPALDELGLLGALREQLHHAAVPVDLFLPEALPALPPAVEVTAYRIVAEAVTNVARHAGASQCRVSVICTDRLLVEVCDNGPASQTWSPGVGLTSMRERTLALGGHWEAGPTPSGGQVRVELPLTLAESAPL